MKKINLFLVLSLAFFPLSLAFAQSQEDQSAYKESAVSWQKQAKDTREKVVGVAEELEEIGDKGNPDAKGLIEDAKRWLQEGDKSMAEANAEMEEEKYQDASYGYNMAWQYYVKAATAGLNAKRILTGK